MPFDCVSFGSREMLILAQDFFIYGMVGAVRKRRRLLDKLTVWIVPILPDVLRHRLGIPDDQCMAHYGVLHNYSRYVRSMLTESSTSMDVPAASCIWRRHIHRFS